MRTLVLMIAVAALGATAANGKVPARAPAQQQAKQPIFDFLGQNTETPSSPFMLGFKNCIPAPSGKTTCSNDLNVVKIGSAQVVLLMMSFNDGKLYSVIGDTIQMAYPDLLAAFTVKYGEPDVTEVRKWQNKIGATFDNSVSIWTFHGGKLELSQMGSRRDSCGFQFLSSKNTPAAPPPTINF